MIGTKLVHIFEGAVRYPVGLVQDCDLVVCYYLYVVCCINMGCAWRRIICINYNYPWYVDVAR